MGNMTSVGPGFSFLFPFLILIVVYRIVGLEYLGPVLVSCSSIVVPVVVTWMWG